MSENNTTAGESKPVAKNSLAAGLILIGIGLGLMLFQAANLAIYLPLLTGLIFLAAGIANHKAGLLIPGGIIGGVGLGTIASQSAWFFPTDSLQAGGVILLAFSLGWFSITLLSKLFTREPQTWALIPGAIMAIIGGLTLMGASGLRILQLAGQYWPAILVIIGLSILIKAWKERK